MDTQKAKAITKSTPVTLTVGIIIGIVGTAYVAGTQVTGLERDIRDNTTQISENKSAIDGLLDTKLDTQVRLTEIQTQLKQIDITLTEIKQGL